MTRQAPVLLLLLLAAVIVVGVSLSAQAPVAKPAKTAAPYVPAKTPWGDPDLQGTYTNKDENGIPMERPGQFAGKTVEDVDDSEVEREVRFSTVRSPVPRGSAVRIRAPDRFTGTNTTTPRTAGHGSSPIRPTGAVRR